jgi:DNA-binding transcriptional LysR family regulator
MVVAVGPDHALAHRKSVSASALAGEPFIGFDADLPIHRQIERYLRDHKVTVELTLHFDNIEMIKQAVAHGVGISLMPLRVMREDLRQGRLIALRLNPPDLYRPVRIVHRRRKIFNEATRGLLALLQEENAHAA